MDKLWNASDVAWYLQVHDMTVYRWVKKGKLPYVKIGGRLRFNKDSIDRMFKDVKQEEVQYEIQQ